MCFNERSYTELQKNLNENYFYFTYGGTEVCFCCMTIWVLITLLLFALVVVFGGYGADFRLEKVCSYIPSHQVKKSMILQPVYYEDFVGHLELCRENSDLEECYFSLNLSLTEAFSCAVDPHEIIKRNDTYEIFYYDEYIEELEYATIITAGIVFPFIIAVIVLVMVCFCGIHCCLFYLKTKYHRNLVELRRKRDEEILKIDRISYDIEDVDESRGRTLLKRQRKVFRHLRNTAIKNKEKIAWKYHPSFFGQLKYYTSHICMFLLNICCSLLVGIFVITFMATVKFQIWWILLAWSFLIIFFLPFYIVNCIFMIMVYNTSYYLTDTRVIDHVKSKLKSRVEVVRDNGNRVILFQQVGSPKVFLNILNDKIKKEKLEMDDDLNLTLM